MLYSVIAGERRPHLFSAHQHVLSDCPRRGFVHFPEQKCERKSKLMGARATHHETIPLHAASDQISRRCNAAPIRLWGTLTNCQRKSRPPTHSMRNHDSLTKCLGKLHRPREYERSRVLPLPPLLASSAALLMRPITAALGLRHSAQLPWTITAFWMAGVCWRKKSAHLSSMELSSIQSSSSSPPPARPRPRPWSSPPPRRS